MTQPIQAVVFDTEHRILRRPDVERKTGFKRAHLYALIAQGKFPKPIKLGVRAVGWDSLEVERWLIERISVRN
ncbi:AlpA family transcriptional regulator [Pseudomonas fluorescens]|uniref:AlpA family transcriptional regulator n=1 Tax=Pseudomonas fluorescens TaxID=294 RepID=UPI001BE7ABFB|nr:AlpA family transcriptional regulator [Pseudomonas fluorescens]MBT2375400.1 AlpA family transcriptional regulator [Pseudomonas fluorescens]